MRLDHESITRLKHLGMTKRGIAYALKVCERTVCRRATRNANDKVQKKMGRPKKVTECLGVKILQHLSVNPETTQNDLVKLFFPGNGIAASGRAGLHRSSLSRFLKYERWSKKRTVKKQSHEPALSTSICYARFQG